MNIQIDRKALAGFRRRAWARYPKKEYVEALFGKIIKGVPTVTLFYDVDHTADGAACYFAQMEILQVSLVAEEYGLEFLGTIHTHIGTDTCAHPSRTDIKSAKESGETIFGVVHLYEDSKGKRRSVTEFYPAKDPTKVTLI